MEINVGAVSVCCVVTWLWRCVWSTRSTPPTEYRTLNYTKHKCRSRCLRESQLWPIKTAVSCWPLNSEWRNHFILDFFFNRPALRNKVSFLLNTVRHSEIIIRHTKEQTEVYFFHIIYKLDQSATAMSGAFWNRVVFRRVSQNRRVHGMSLVYVTSLYWMNPKVVDIIFLTIGQERKLLDWKP